MFYPHKSLKWNLTYPNPALVREYIAYPCMDFPKIHGYPYGYPWFVDVKSPILHTSADIHIDIQAKISLQGHSTMKHEFPRMDIHVLWISVFKYPCFYYYPVWISIDFYGYPCMDLLWILDPNLSVAWRSRRGTEEIVPLSFLHNFRLQTSAEKKASSRMATDAMRDECVTGGRMRGISHLT